jgi:cell wall assembly regulator SMI1
VSQSWDDIKAWLASRAPPLRKSLRPGASEAAIARLQARLGVALPGDFLESARLHDGQKSSAEHGLFPMTDDVLGPMPSCRLLPVTEIAREWSMMKELHDQGEFAGRKSAPQRGVRDDWWNTGWVPIADNGGGDYYCLDLAPARGGVAGQVIAFFHDMNDRPRVARSFAAWLRELADGLKAGKYLLSEEEGIIED